jgi:hypothetical protein
MIGPITRHRRSTTPPTPAIPAGSPPAAPPLASARQIGPQPHRQSGRATHTPLVHATRRTHSSSQSNRVDRCGQSSPHRTTPLNPHSARCNGAPHPRDFVPWRFSDAGRKSAWLLPAFRRSENLHMPRAFAALRLTTISSIFGNSTGRSAGFAPFRILSTKEADSCLAQ